MTSTDKQQPKDYWEIKKWGHERIVPVSVIKETDKTLWIESKYAAYLGEIQTQIERRLKTENFHETWQSAHDYLINQTKLEIECQKRYLSDIERRLREIEKMKPPTECLD